MSDQSARIAAYAQLVVEVGAALEPGRQVVVNADVAHAEIVRAVADAAYRAGASRVTVNYTDLHVRRSEVEHAPEETLRSVPQWVFDRWDSWVDSGASVITLTGNPNPHLMDGLDPARLAAVPMDFVSHQRGAMVGGALPWTIVAAPNAGWAQQVFGEPDLDRLWDVVATALRLDVGDAEAVVAEWRAHERRLAQRASFVTSLQLDAVRYHGGGTDLTVGLPQGAVWIGGGLHTTEGRLFMPNLPTEEVFTSPDRHRADGVLRVTQPLVMPRAGALVEGLVVRFEGGRIVEATADRGQEAVLAELDTDEGARSLGEVSLVDASSAVRAAGVTFHDTLYDENAGCHVAWGQSFPFALEGGLQLSPEERTARGLNTSAVHTDVVVGAPGVSVDGLRANGSVVPLITDDRWVIAAE